MQRALGILAAITGLAFGYAAVHISLFGSGASLPVENALETNVADVTTIPGPAGEDFAFGEVIITRPGTRGVEQSWTGIYGERDLTMANGETYTMPDPREWEGIVPFDYVEVNELEALSGMPLATDGAEEVSRHIPPPYVVGVHALRPGDSIVAEVSGDSLTNVHVGSRAELEEWLGNRENGRWPAVALLGVMAFVSVLFARRSLLSPKDA